MCSCCLFSSVSISRRFLFNWGNKQNSVLRLFEWNFFSSFISSHYNDFIQSSFDIATFPVSMAQFFIRPCQCFNFFFQFKIVKKREWFNTLNKLLFSEQNLIIAYWRKNAHNFVTRIFPWYVIWAVTPYFKVEMSKTGEKIVIERNNIWTGSVKRDVIKYEIFEWSNKIQNADLLHAGMLSRVSSLYAIKVSKMLCKRILVCEFLRRKNHWVNLYFNKFEIIKLIIT